MANQWTAKETRRLRELHEAGETAKAISKMLGRTPKSVSSRIAVMLRSNWTPHRIGYSRADQNDMIAMREAGAGYEEIGAKYGIPTRRAKEAVNKWRHRNRKGRPVEARPEKDLVCDAPHLQGLPHLPLELRKVFKGRRPPTDEQEQQLGVEILRIAKLVREAKLAHGMLL